jgi:hypothetical protein
VDEKSQIQALDRSRPMLPIRPGQAAPRTHDYKRLGTTSLFAALDIAHRRRHRQNATVATRAREFRKFLDEIEAADLTSIPSWTTTPPTRRRSFAAGLPSGRAGMRT